MRISEIFPRSAGLSPGSFESFCAILCNSSCDILILTILIKIFLFALIIESSLKNQAMSLKNTFTSILKDSQKRVDILYDASKIVFFVSLFFFLLILFFVSAEFFDGFLQVFLLPSYVAAISSMGIFFSFFVLQF